MYWTGTVLRYWENSGKQDTVLALKACSLVMKINMNWFNVLITLIEMYNKMKYLEEAGSDTWAGFWEMNKD